MCLERSTNRSNSAKGIEDLNGDGIMDLRVISDELSASANRVVWDCSNETDKVELRQLQAREQPELPVGSPSSSEVTSLLSARPKRGERGTESVEPQIRAYVQAYEEQMRMQKHFVHEHPRDSASWKMPEVQGLADDPRVYIIVGPTCGWNMRARISAGQWCSCGRKRGNSQDPWRLLKYFAEMEERTQTHAHDRKVSNRV